MTHEYVGTELDLFAQATNWKRYLQSVVSPFLTGDVLEVGAGIGTTTRAFSDGSASTWLCREPDGGLAERARGGFDEIPVPASPSVHSHPVQDLDPDRSFDCILYVDVLEHIEDDRDELARAQNHFGTQPWCRFPGSWTHFSSGAPANRWSECGDSVKARPAAGSLTHGRASAHVVPIVP